MGISVLNVLLGQRPRPMLSCGPSDNGSVRDRVILSKHILKLIMSSVLADTRCRFQWRDRASLRNAVFRELR